MRDMISNEEIGKNIQKARKKAGYKSARSYSEHIGISVNTYTAWEQGRHEIGLFDAMMIAEDLGISLQKLVAGKDALIRNDQQN